MHKSDKQRKIEHIEMMLRICKKVIALSELQYKIAELEQRLEEDRVARENFCLKMLQEEADREITS